jgi:hypothetical protein
MPEVERILRQHGRRLTEEILSNRVGAGPDELTNLALKLRREPLSQIIPSIENRIWNLKKAEELIAATVKARSAN